VWLLASCLLFGYCESVFQEANAFFCKSVDFKALLWYGVLYLMILRGYVMEENERPYDERDYEESPIMSKFNNVVFLLALAHIALADKAKKILRIRPQKESVKPFLF
jgi:hypothetical protein